MTNNQTKCGSIYEKIAMRAGDDERMIMGGLQSTIDTRKIPQLDC